MSNEKALATVNGTALQYYGNRDEVREMTDRLLALHPASAEVGQKGMRAVAQLAILVGASPLPSTNEIHVWKDNRDNICIQLGINYYRRMAEKWGGVLWVIPPRQMRDDEREEYGVPEGIVAAICKAVRVADMERFTAMGMTPVQVFDMAGRVGVATLNKNEYAKQGRPVVWTAFKRCEIDLYRALFPSQMVGLAAEQKAHDIQVDVSPEVQQMTIDEINYDLYETPMPPDIIEDGDFIEDEPESIEVSPFADLAASLEELDVITVGMVADRATQTGLYDNPHYALAAARKWDDWPKGFEVVMRSRFTKRNRAKAIKLFWWLVDRKSGEEE